MVTVRENSKTHGVELRLVIGPIADVELASRLCGTLLAGRHYCQPVAFEGQRLSLIDTEAGRPRPRLTTKPERTSKSSHHAAEAPAPQPRCSAFGPSTGNDHRGWLDRTRPGSQDCGASLHSFRSPMPPRLFLPTARQTNWLLVIGFLALGEALYLRYLAMNMPPSRWPARPASRRLCTTFRLVITLFNHSAFGWIALTAALLNLLRPSVLLGVDRARRSTPSGWCCTTPICPGSQLHSWLSTWRGALPPQSTTRQTPQAGAEPQRPASWRCSH